MLSARDTWSLTGPQEVLIVEDDLTLHRGFKHDLVRDQLVAKDPIARKAAAVLLAHFGDKTDVPRLENLYQHDPEDDVRWVGAIGVREMRRRGL
jgi:hypothetical protein